jgi:hypothetical protein
MDLLLIVTSLVSLGFALVAGVVAWRASRLERQRAAARVAALAAAAEVPPPTAVTGSAGTIAEPARAPSSAAAPWRSPGGAVVSPEIAMFASEADRPSPAREASTPPDSVTLQAGFLGSDYPAPEGSTRQRWLAVAAALVAMMLGGIVVVRMTGHAQPAVAAHQVSAPLELLSLRHEREGVNLSVAGLVRNPAAAPIVERLSAVVFLFDQQGQFVTSAKAPIDFLKLTPGDESPFVVKVAAPQSVARYRVSFRTEDGTLPHVDRRADPPASAPVALTRQQGDD